MKTFSRALLLAAAIIATTTSLADARGGFMAMRGARMNFGGGGMHGMPGGFNVPHHMEPRFHPQNGGFEPHPPFGPRPPEPGPHPPGPPPGPHPPGPGPHPPGPPPGPHPPGPPRPYPVPVPYWPGYWDDDDWWMGAAAGVATTLALGTIMSNTPADCEDVTIHGYSYKHCGSTWLQAQYQGHKIVYVVVSDPR